eukprot:SAG31_NODE_3149_length_4618_cov_1.653242_4_plen_134_part_00
MADIVDRRLLKVLVNMMDDRTVNDRGLSLLRMAAVEWLFSAEDAGKLVARFKDSAARIEAVAVLIPRVVDEVNLNGLLFEQLSDRELCGLERKIGKLFYFTGQNPTGHYKLQLEAKYDFEILKKIVEVGAMDV